MERLYVVSEPDGPGCLYYNEHPEGNEEEIMTLEDAKYTANLLGCVVYKLEKYEE